MKTLIQGGYVVGFNGREHQVIRDGVVAFERDRVLFVGKQYTEPVDKKIDAKGCLVSPGLIDTHFHSGGNASDYLLNDANKVDYFASNYLAHGAPTREGARHAHLKDIDVGQRFSLIHGLKRAVEFAKKFNGACNGRMGTMLFPGHVDTCTPELLKETRKAAKELGVRVQIHAAINLIEFHTVMRRYRLTPVELLGKIGFLDPEVSLSHCVFLTGHSWTAYPYGDDLKRITDSGASVAHSPLKYLKIGVAMESFDRYLKAGINVGIGTDTFPKDIISEMRYAALVSRLVDKSFIAGHPRDVFNAATVGGARLIGRDDLGRLQKGAKADITIINLRDIAFGAVRDPIKALVETAAGRDVRTVIVDGEILVDQGTCLRVYEDELIEKLQARAEEIWAGVPKWHWTGKGVDEVLPPAF